MTDDIDVGGPEPRRRSFDHRAAALGLELRSASKHPTAVRLVDGVVTAGNLLFVSGTGPISSGRATYAGKVGATVGVEEARRAARATALRVLEKIISSVGSLDRVKRWVSVTGFVNAVDEFVDHPQVLDGFTDLVVEVFGDKVGLCSRCAVGVSSLPLGIPVEVQVVVELGDEMNATLD